MLSKKIDVIVPSWENKRQEHIAKSSISSNTALNLRFYKFENKDINKGWMGFCNEGIKASLDDSDSDYVLLSNDDILVAPTGDWGNMVSTMERYNKIGALGPLTNRACGWSNLTPQNSTQGNLLFLRVPYISFFFVLLRKEAIKEVGLLDESLPGGDDLDYSFRLNDKGWMTCVTPKVYVHHEYAQTGKKIYGSYWDSPEHSEKITKALIDKHGFKRYVYGMTGYQDKENSEVKK